MQHQKRQQRRERGLEEEHERRCLRTRDLHRQEVAGEADAGHADVDEEHDREVGQRVAGEEGDARKRVQTGGRQAGREGRNVCQTCDRDHLGRAEQKAEARHDDAAEARALALAAHAVEREQRRRQQDVHHTERIEPQVPRLDDEHDACHVQHEARNLVFRDRLVQEQEGEQRHEHGVAGKQHADDRSLDARDG